MSTKEILDIKEIEKKYKFFFTARKVNGGIVQGWTNLSSKDLKKELKLENKILKSYLIIENIK